jgi:hypothetical protein
MIIAKLANVFLAARISWLESRRNLYKAESRGIRQAVLDACGRCDKFVEHGDERRVVCSKDPSYKCDSPGPRLMERFHDHEWKVVSASLRLMEAKARLRGAE